MSPLAITVALVALIAGTFLIGTIWKTRTGRVKTLDGSAEVVDLPDVPIHGQVTLLQFSTAVCSACRPTHTLLDSIARERDDVEHVDLDVTTRPEIAARFNILQTPTTLILDARGIVRGRIGGAPRRADVQAAIEGLLTPQIQGAS